MKAEGLRIGARLKSQDGSEGQSPYGSKVFPATNTSGLLGKD